MSDPVTQAEIEDVLSSIRRLVSEDGRTTPRPQPVENPPKIATRLVLTPALRVSNEQISDVDHLPAAASPGNVQVDEAGPAEKQDETDAADDLVSCDLADVITFAPDSSGDLDAGQGMLDAAASTSTTPTPTEASDETGSNTKTAGALLPGADNVLTATSDTSAQVVESTLDADAAPWRDPDATLFHAAASSAEELASEVVNPVDSSTETETDIAEADFVKDAGPTANSEASVGEAVEEIDVTLHAADEQVVNPAEGTATIPQSAGAGGSVGVSAVVQKIAELEAKVGRSEEQWEPDGLSRDPYAGTNIETLEWKDHLEGEPEETLDWPVADTEASPRQRAEHEDGRSGQAQSEKPADMDAERLVEETATAETIEQVEALAGEENFLDEESLRELVAEIVRSELQGALGERITRNVRKLVRREIHRALSAQDLI